MRNTTFPQHTLTRPIRSACLLGTAFALALALAGCSPTPDDVAPGDGAGAGRFAACLAAAGVPAKAVDPGYVVVRVAGPGQDDTAENVGIGALLTLSDEDGTWVAPADAEFFEDDAAARDAYAACETDHPDFAQPAVSVPGGAADEGADALAEALAFTRCARDAGFAWLADPDPESGGSIVLPPSLTESEFRALLAACPPTDYPAGLGWSVTGDLSFDWTAVLDEFAEAATTGDTSTRRVPS
ncbi:hypothetical protein [Microbacterium imperiale]|uniref:Septum formation-related domain-containing protein n=1 Tax=Microbacterium imperiale TaxID=33884 RepID=A0A9W6HFV9_9MICO|nr:hypothetical protein [Microbacterium imperiale]MBP2419420.1 hypothetical protein [Microbacterium imperiale]MDS0198710.1 hypothetical protein [Microbacterium imperiale]BFE39762.1 hypothetical protein GCM10017544_07180 [Microbacterium imperiale]GLJ79263.1 hypothetical protein GCM10017586_09450 [Microbacterium imperiale]